MPFKGQDVYLASRRESFYTWPKLQNRGQSEPNIYALCKSIGKFTEHIMLTCESLFDCREDVSSFLNSSNNLSVVYYIWSKGRDIENSFDPMFIMMELAVGTSRGKETT